FYHPIRKVKGIDLSDTEVKYNNVFGSFRSKIESTFAELGNTFERLNNCKYIKVSDIEIFTLQMKLACILLNIKKFVVLANISHESSHSKWPLDNFDYNYQEDIDENELQININVKTKFEHGEQMLKLQQQFISINRVVVICYYAIDDSHGHHLLNLAKISHNYTIISIVP